MVNYSNGKIYKLESQSGDKIYIGSTTKERLCQRMDTLRHNYDSWKNGTSELTTAYEIFEEYGVKNCQLVLLESYPCTCKDELESRKAFYIKSMDCVNKVIPNRTQQEYREDNKERTKEHRQKYNKQYNEDNKEKRIQQRAELFVCECGQTIAKSSKSKHIKGKPHLDKMNK